MSECSAYIQVMLLLCYLHSPECSYIIDNLHVKRTKVDVFSHVESSLHLFHVPFYLRGLNSL